MYNIVIEGIDFSGKSTLCRTLSGLMGLQVLRHPNGLLREKLLVDSPLISSDEEILLHCAGFLESARLSKETDRNCIFDRYIPSCYAYNYDYATNAGRQILQIVSEQIQKDKPYVVFYLEISLSTMKERARERIEKNKYDLMPDTFYEHCATTYEALCNYKLDGEQPTLDIAKQIIRILSKKNA